MEYVGITLQEYLIKNSGVNRQFIKDFIAIQQSDITREYYPFVIDLELIIRWLQINQKGHLKETLKKSYIKNRDYILLSPRRKQKKNHGGHNKETILVTIKCFKKLCLKTKSIMADKIIDYYIALENLLVEYQQYIISILIKENKLLKNDLNNDIFPLGGLIYIVDLGNGYYKLGYTSNLKQRKLIYETGSIHKKKIIFWFETEDMISVEKCVKGLLTKFALKKKKEVYLIELDKIIKYVRGCAGMISNTTCTVCDKPSRIKNIEKHFDKYHPLLMKSNFIIDSNLNQIGGQNNCLEMKILIEKEEKKVYLITDHISSFQYIVKEGFFQDIFDESNAYKLLYGLQSRFVIDCLPEIYSINPNQNEKYVLIQEYIKGLSGHDLQYIKNDCWTCILFQLAYFISILEKNKIQHNDFHLGNIIIEFDEQNKKFQLKVIDLETLTDYQNKIVYSDMIKKSPADEKIRMGWNDKFHPGSDLNQILGELLEKYGENMPKSIYDAIEPRIKRYEKEFPYAISESNKLTTGVAILRVLCQMDGSSVV